MVHLHPRMAKPIDPDDEPFLQSRYEAWLAERELMSAAMVLRDADAGVAVGRERIAYEAAWMRFMVALCNLPVAQRPLEVERVLEALREAHLLHCRGDLSSLAPHRPSQAVESEPTGEGDD